jgi:SAM-dependent methyltransferase
MFWPYVVDLKEFYSSPLGQRAAHALKRAIMELWPPAAEDTVLGIGYAAPYLDAYLRERALVLACMPSAQGAMMWPQGRANLSLLTDETALPISDNLVNKVLVVHALENTEQSYAMLEEIWRVLTPGGRVLVVVPNRHGMWARSLASPFSQGRPYSAAQLKSLLSECRFTPGRCTHALYLMPSQRRFCLRLSGILESLGWLYPRLGGAVLMEAEKQIYASVKESAVVRKRPVLVPDAKPVMGRI